MKQKRHDNIESETSLFEIMDTSINLMHSQTPMAIMDLENNYRCVTTAFTNNVIGSPKENVIGRTAHDFAMFDGHVEKIFKVRKEIQPCQAVTWLRIHEYPSGKDAHIVQETPIVNPFTQKIFAIQCSGGQALSINHVLHSIIKMHNKQLGKNQSFTLGTESNFKLGIIQEEVLFCLLLGYKGYKFIADFINSIKNTKYTDVTVRNAINGLYQKFEAEGNINILIQKAISLNLHTYIPKGFLNAGVTLITAEQMPLSGPISPI